MNKIYKYPNATIIIANSNVIDLENLQRSTENFLKKVIIEERNSDGNCNTSGDINKK
jgi:hypothetical protein